MVSKVQICKKYKILVPLVTDNRSLSEKEFDAIGDNNFICEYFDAEKMKQLYRYEADND